MKVLYDISWLGNSFGKPWAGTGLDRVIENLAYHLAKQPACQVRLCAGYDFASLEGSLRFLETKTPLKGNTFTYPRFKASYCWKTNYLLERLYKEYGRNIPVWLMRRALLWGNEKICGRGRSLSSSSLNWAQIYHSPFLSIPRGLRRRGRLKRVLTVYDLIPFRFPELAPEGSAQMLQETLDSLRDNDVVLCISETTKKDLCNHLKWFDPARVFVTHLGASGEFHSVRSVSASLAMKKKYGIPNARYFLALGSLEPRKGLTFLIECFAKMVAESKLGDVNLVVAGAKGWKYEKIFETLDRYEKLRDRIILTGRVADEDLAPLYSNALAFVFPSSYEGFGLPPLEAMQCGAPVITSNSSSLPEVVGNAGIMVGPRDEDALCQAMLDIYQNEQLQTSLSAKSLERAGLFSWEKCARDTIAAYQFALQS